MQIELAPDVEARIQAVAEVRGMSVSKLLEEFVIGRADVPQVASPGAERDPRAVIEEHVAWMKRTSPDWETADPYAVDWQAVKADGRKY